jgi:hypothetical protein
MKPLITFLAALGFVLLLIAPGMTLSAKPYSSGNITGGVYDYAGRPVRSVWVVVRQDNQEKGRSLTGDDGKYYIAGLENGAYALTVMRLKTTLVVNQVHLPENRIHNITVPTG